MPYGFEFDSTNGVLQGRLEGRVTSEELVEYYRAAVKCARLKEPRSGITDLTGVTAFEASSQTIRELANTRPAIPNPDLLRVIVASSPDVYGLARMFESHGEATRPNLHVVRTCKEALAIIGVVEPKFEPIDLAALDLPDEKK
jgi:hypothetical protein